ncbi:MAG: hypothetical protein SXG53_13920 [Pseudomonadota bacterium]|nr:hypothetical protein [Pseudomonadota bacterium]
MAQLSVRRDFHTGVLTGLMSSASPADQLRDWLAGRWAVLFSNPDDFADYGFEADRWLMYTQNTFDSLRLRPIAVGYDSSGWISQIGGRLISRSEANALVHQSSSWPSSRQRSSARHDGPEHFATILDGSANARRTVLYRPASGTPSLIELVQTAVHLRERGVPTSVSRILQSV